MSGHDVNPSGGRPRLGFEQAVALHRTGRWLDAEALCKSILETKRDHAGAMNLLGVIAAQTSRQAEAVQWLGRAVAAAPRDVALLNNYGWVLRDVGRLGEALGIFERALRISPDYPDAQCNRALTLQQLGRPIEALSAYDTLLRVWPDHADAHNNRGNVLNGLGRLEEALISYERALSVRPDHADPHSNRGTALQALGRHAEALASFERALQLKPDYAEAHNNRGTVLALFSRGDEALASFERALQIKPDFAEAHKNRGTVLQELGRHAEALPSLERALEITPDRDWLLGAWLFTKMTLWDWRDHAAHAAELHAAIVHGRRAAAPFAVLALADSPPLQRRAADIWLQQRPPITAVSLPPGTLERNHKIRVGYYSGDFHDHPVAVLAAGLFEHHDRESFDVLGFSYGPDRRDAMRARLSSAFDQFIDVRMMSDQEVAQLSRDLRVDIAVDLKGFTQGARPDIFAHRAASIQISYLGYPGTLSAPFMDYLIADETLIPQRNRGQYAEKIVYLPNSYQVNDRRRRIAEREFSRAELGLPPAAFVFCCFNHPYKIAPATFDAWMRILRRVDDSVLWLLKDDDSAADRLRVEAARRGLGTERLVFAGRMPNAEHLARHRAADLFLDTLPYNAHTTASDALWAGLPVLTLSGESFAARVGASLLTAAGLPELIARTPEEYEAAAFELATDRRKLADLRGRLHSTRLTLPLFDTELFTRHIEDAYRQTLARHVAGARPDHIYVAR